MTQVRFHHICRYSLLVIVLIITTDASVSFERIEYSVSEDAGAVSICVDSGVTEGFQTDMTVTLSVHDGTACKEKIYSHIITCILEWFLTL